MSLDFSYNMNLESVQQMTEVLEFGKVAFCAGSLAGLAYMQSCNGSRGVILALGQFFLTQYYRMFICVVAAVAISLCQLSLLHK